MTDADDTRSIELEVEVPGTPEEIWEAIATGPGFSIWAIPADIEPREGGTVTLHHGGGHEQTGSVSIWDPPHRWAFEMEFSPSERVPARPVGLELLVEARSGDTCVVRLVQSGFGPEADWDAQIDSTRTGWRRCLRVLQLYLERFPGKTGAQLRAFGATDGPLDRGWSVFAEAVGLGEPAPGERVRIAAPGAPAVAGTVDETDEATVTLVLDEPAAGIGTIAAGGPGDPVYVTVSATLFGDGAAEVASTAQRAWQGWMDERFPFAAATSGG